MQKQKRHARAIEVLEVVGLEGWEKHSLTRSLFVLGAEVGLALVLMAIVLDRYTQGWGERLKLPAER